MTLVRSRAVVSHGLELVGLDGDLAEIADVGPAVGPEEDLRECRVALSARPTARPR